MKFTKAFLFWCVLTIGLACYTFLYVPKPDSYGQDTLHFDETLNEYVVSDNGKTRVVKNLCWCANTNMEEGLFVSFVCFGDNKFYVFPYKLDEDTAVSRGHKLYMTPIWLVFALISIILFVFTTDDEETYKIVHAD